MKTKGKIFVFVLLVILLAIVMFLSLSIGAKSFSFSALLEAFTTQNESFEFSVIQQRLPRTIFGVLTGASLAVSGCLMQNITRNPIADPGVLGVNSGAALFVVCGISFFHISGPFPYIVFGLWDRIFRNGSDTFEISISRSGGFDCPAVYYQYDHNAKYTSDGYFSILADRQHKWCRLVKRALSLVLFWHRNGSVFCWHIL